MREHYASRGFDPASKLSAAKEAAARLGGKAGMEPKPSRHAALVVFLTGLVLVAAGALAILLSSVRYGPLTLTGLALFCAAAWVSVCHQAGSRQGRERLALRRRLLAARRYFAHELGKQHPTLRDEWMPYLSGGGGVGGSGGGGGSSSGGGGGGGW